MSTNMFRGGLCDCGGCGPCMAAFFCAPCLYGRYAKRIDDYPGVPPSDDPMSYFNTDCAMFWLLGYVGANFLPLWFKRTDQRRKFDIEGNAFKDCCTAYWCLPCALAQQNLDIKERAQEGFPVSTAVQYKTHEKMTYSQPQPQTSGIVTTVTEAVPQ